MAKGTSYGRQMNSQELSTNGDGTGTVEATVDGSSVNVEFKLTCEAGDIHYEVGRVIIFVEDSGNLLAGSYGALAGLTNGTLVTVCDADGNTTGQIGHVIKNNAQWAKFCHDSQPHDYGSGDNALASWWSFSDAGEPLHLGPGESLVFTIRDDLTGLVEHTFVAEFTKVR